MQIEAWYFLSLNVIIVEVAQYLNCLAFRLDGSAEPANEILEQTSHERPLVAQAYSTAVAKGTHSASRAFSLILGMESCVKPAWLCSSRLPGGSGSSGWSWCGGRHECPAPG